MEEMNRPAIEDAESCRTYESPSIVCLGKLVAVTGQNDSAHGFSGATSRTVLLSNNLWCQTRVQ
ncbi:MAG TPA: hypothetical protein VFG50_04040 [Rhodothermales bacterium]|nr:hypothetical protein [Rhodothermales bacterium]